MPKLSYLCAVSSVVQTDELGGNGVVRFDSIALNLGSAIAFDAAACSFSLEAGRAYELTGTAGMADFYNITAGALTYCWFDEGTMSYIGTGGGIENNVSTHQQGSSPHALAPLSTATGRRTVSLRIVWSDSVISIGNATTRVLPCAVIRELQL
jgi:hypothetical protein